MIKMLGTLIVLITAACQPAGGPAGTDVEPIISPVDSTQDSTIHYETDHQVTFSMDGMSFGLNKLPGWRVHFAENGVIMAEQAGSISTGGKLQGLLAYIFIPPLEDFSLPVVDGVNLAWSVLQQVTHKSKYESRVMVTEPLPFSWSGRDAAYYLMNDGRGVMTLIIAVTSSRSNQLLAVHVSAPITHASLMRKTVFQLLDGLTLDGIALDASALEVIPDPLVFPDQNVPASDPTPS